MPTSSSLFITPNALLQHWQGHRRLTRRVIDAFPDDKLFAFSIGGMRPFGGLALEMLSMAVPMVQGAISGEWKVTEPRSAAQGATSSPRGMRRRPSSTRSCRSFRRRNSRDD